MHRSTALPRNPLANLPRTARTERARIAGLPLGHSMTILHVTDFHFNRRWFNWLLSTAGTHDVVVMSGDMLDLSVATPARRQIEWVSDWLDEFPSPLFVCSGNHDLEWNSESEHWAPAYWLRDVTNPHVFTDGQRVRLDGLNFLSLGVTMRPKGGEADVWVVHAAPRGTLVTKRANGADAGDPDLVYPARRAAPRLVLSGHVHTPLAWREQRDGTLFLNPGRCAYGPVPNHIVVQTDDMSSQLFTGLGVRSHDPVFPTVQTVGAESPAALTAAG